MISIDFCQTCNVSALCLAGGHGNLANAKADAVSTILVLTHAGEVVADFGALEQWVLLLGAVLNTRAINYALAEARPWSTAH